MKKKKSGIRYVYHEAFKNDKTMIPVMVLSFCFRTLAPLVFAFAPALLLSIVTQSPDAGRAVKAGLLLLFLSTAVIGLNSCFENLSFFKIEQLRSEVFTSQFLAKTLRVKYSSLEDQTFQNLVYSGYGVVNNERSGCSCILNQSVTIPSAIVDIIIFAVFIFRRQSVWILAAVLLVLLCNIIMAALIGNLAYKNESQETAAHRKMNYYTKICLGFEYAKDVRSFPLPRFVLKKYDSVFQNLTLLKKRDGKRIIAVEATLLFFLVAAESLFYLFLIYQNLSCLDIPNLFLLLSIFTLLPDLVGGLIDDAGRFFMAVRQAASLTLMLGYEDEPEEGSAAFDLPLDLTMKEVNFRYSGKGKKILKNVSLSIPQGQKIAIVGKNGSGKTTLIKLLLKFYDSYEGTITFAGKNMLEIPKSTLYGLTGCLFQKSKLFASSIRENVVLNKTYDAERFSKAIEDAGLTRKLNSLHKGEETLLDHSFSENAVDLSGGEQQKLLFARILYQQPQIVILDEPTAAMDVIAEERFYARIKELLPQSTIIFISHRLSSTKFCDAIYVMDKGSIVESGTHEQLLKKDGAYCEMYRLQSKFYQKEYGKVLRHE